MSVALPFFMKYYAKVARYFKNMFLFKKNLNKFASQNGVLLFCVKQYLNYSSYNKRIFD